MQVQQQRLSTTEKLAYGLGDSAANLIFQTQITFLLYFYTDVYGIAAGTAGLIVLVSRTFDAFTDPVVGALADRTNTRWGRYRPWLLLSAVPLAASLVLCFTTPPLTDSGKVLWAIGTYNVLMILYAANNIPYCALSGVMTADPLERTSLASWRFICAMGAAFAVNTFTVDLVARFGNGDSRLGYPLAMALWAVIGIALTGITFAFTRERVQPVVKKHSSIRQDLSDLTHNGQWLALFAVAVLIHIQLAMRSGALLFYFHHYLTLPPIVDSIDNFGLFNGVGLIFTITGVALAKPLVAKFGNRATFGGCLVVSSVLMAAFAIVPPDSFYALFGLQICLQLAFGPTIPILWSMMADVADYSEWLTGRRSTALAFASIIFGLKLGLGFGAWLAGGLLQLFHYSSEAPATDSSNIGIVSMISIFPAAVLLACACTLLIYRLDGIFMDKIERDLLARRAALEPAT